MTYEYKGEDVAGTTTRKVVNLMKIGANDVRVNSSVTETFLKRTMSRTSTTTPGYPRPGPSGLPFNKFGFVGSSESQFIGFWRSDFPEYSGPAYGSYTEKSGVIFSYPSVSQLRFSFAEEVNQNNAVFAALNLKLKNQKVNYAQAVGERDQVKRMLITNVNRIRLSYSLLKRGNFRGAARVLGIRLKSGSFTKRFGIDQQKAIASGWLELQYGWLPLMSDIFGTISIFNDRNKDRDMTFSVRAKKSFSDNQTYVTNAEKTRTVTTQSVTRDVTVICHYRISSSSFKTMSELGLMNPVGLAWELLPFSFVVDWFAHIGNFLSAFDSSVGTEFVKGGLTSFIRKTNRITIEGNGKKFYNAGWTHYSSEVGSATAVFETVECVRDPLGSNPLPILPVVKNPVSDLHVANALALLTATFRK